MSRSIDGPECPHGVNYFDPRGCAQCTRELAQRRGGVAFANGGHPSRELIREKFAPTESD